MFCSGFPADIPDPYARTTLGQKVSPHHRGHRKTQFLVRTSTIWRGRPWPEGFSKNCVQKKSALIFWPLIKALLLKQRPSMFPYARPRSLRYGQRLFAWEFFCGCSLFGAYVSFSFVWRFFPYICLCSDACVPHAGLQFCFLLFSSLLFLSFAPLSSSCTPPFPPHCGRPPLLPSVSSVHFSCHLFLHFCSLFKFLFSLLSLFLSLFFSMFFFSILYYYIFLLCSHGVFCNNNNNNTRDYISKKQVETNSAM